jgi:phage tail-like protein
MPLRRLAPTLARLGSGFFLAGPYTTLARALAWQRLRVYADPLDPATHVQLYSSTAFVTNGNVPAAPALSQDDDLFASPGWSACPSDELDVLVLSDALRAGLSGPPPDPTADQDPGPLGQVWIWIGGVLQGDGQISPTLRQMRLDFAPPPYLEDLPSIYRDGVQRSLLVRLILAEMGSELDVTDDLMADLPRLFDANATPDTWLPWLAGWLDLDLVTPWTAKQVRQQLVECMRLYSQRGTASGLREAIQLYTGVSPFIEEPCRSVAVFCLDGSSSVGATTVVAPANSQGAVLGTTAILGGSDVIAPEQMGVPVFADIVNRFCVQVYAAQVEDPSILGAINQVVARQAPAHTLAHVCLIQPAMRVGHQARLGIDTIVGGPTPDMRLDASSIIGLNAVLANLPPRSERVGFGLRVG